ncbi:MAG: fructosamine kinase family protein, partial [Acidobacteriota bacterium]
IAHVTGEPTEISATRAASGGCIHQANVVRTGDGRCFFVKSNPAAPPALFEREAEGLEALAATETIRVPRPLGTGTGEAAVPAFLVAEAIDTGSPGRGFWETFGRRFAALHRANSERVSADTRRFGFAHDNFIGATPQPNAWDDDWCEFWRHHRLGFQLELARRNGLSDPTLDRLGDRLLARLDGLIDEPDEPPCLLHGDLWSGNFMSDEHGEPVLIDPAAYYGRREADLAMTELFGGFNARFYSAYEEAWPLAPGSRERLDLYQLYHLLNHLNLFGHGYRDRCVAILRRLT